MIKLKKADQLLGKVMDIIPIALLLFLLVILVANIFFRFVPVYSMKWYNEIVELAFAWLIFIGTAALWRRNEHTLVDFLPIKIEGKFSGKLLSLVVEVLKIGFAIIFVYYSAQLCIKTTAVSPILQISRKFFYISMPISGSIMFIYSLKNIIELSFSMKKSNFNENESVSSKSIMSN